jgi:hypothetical protein
VANANAPWARARQVRLDLAARSAKAAAVACFRTQTQPIGDRPADRPVLPERFLAHFRRGVEVVLA